MQVLNQTCSTLASTQPLFYTCRGLGRARLVHSCNSYVVTRGQLAPATSHASAVSAGWQFTQHYELADHIASYNYTAAVELKQVYYVHCARPLLYSFCVCGW